MIKFVPWYDEYISPDCQPTRHALVCFKHYFEAQYMSKFMQVLALSIDGAQYIDRNMFLLLRNDSYILERDLSGTFHTLYFLLTPRFMHFPSHYFGDNAWYWIYLISRIKDMPDKTIYMQSDTVWYEPKVWINGCYEDGAPLNSMAEVRDVTYQSLDAPPNTQYMQNVLGRSVIEYPKYFERFLPLLYEPNKLYTLDELNAIATQVLECDLHV